MYATQYKTTRQDGTVKLDKSREYQACFSSYSLYHQESSNFEATDIFTVYVDKEYDSVYSGFCAHMPFSSEQVKEFVLEFKKDGFKLELGETKERYEISFLCADMKSKTGIRCILDFIRALYEGYGEDKKSITPQSSLVEYFKIPKPIRSKFSIFELLQLISIKIGACAAGHQLPSRYSSKRIRANYYWDFLINRGEELGSNDNEGSFWLWDNCKGRQVSPDAIDLSSVESIKIHIKTAQENKQELKKAQENEN